MVCEDFEQGRKPRSAQGNALEKIVPPNARFHLPSWWIVIKVIYHTFCACFFTMFQGMLGIMTVKLGDKRLDRWSRNIIRDAKMRMVVTGREHVKPDELYVIMSNHQSLYDIPVLFQSIPKSLRMVAKKELFRIPIWSHGMKHSGFISLDRSSRTRAMESLARAARIIHEKQICVWIAPEGTRSLTGIVGTFKRGGFYLAREAKVKILPVTISGTRLILPAHQARIYPGLTAYIDIHPPIDPADFNGEEAKLMEHVRQAIISTLKN